MAHYEGAVPFSIDGVHFVQMNTFDSPDELGHECIMRFLALRKLGMIGRLYPLRGEYFLEDLASGQMESIGVEGVRRRIDYWFPRTDMVQRRGPGRETLEMQSRYGNLHFR